jgi:MFS transporter, DHA3 family, macrolide efflux protein
MGQLIGVGRGRGIGLLFVMMGAGFLLTMVASYFHPRLRHVEDELPDVLPAKSDMSSGHVPVLN